MITVSLEHLGNYKNWDQLCDWVIETYGLPFGARWNYNSTSDEMIFEFEDSKDAMLFMLRWGGKRVVDHAKI
jgi:hypothetical protein